MFKDFCHQLGTKVAFTSIYRPQSNGAVERANTLIFEAIKKILEGEKKGKWTEILLKAVRSHNTTVLRATNFTPFCLLFGAKAVLPEEIKCHTPFREIGNEASIRVPRMFKSHAWQQYDKQMQCY
jgi:hypothetical protein